MRVLKYIDYIQEIEKDSSKNGLQVINQISSHLKFAIFSDCYGKILLQNKNFALNYSKATIEKLTLKIQEKLYVPGEIIFEQGEQDTRLFYLIKGECEYYLQNKEGNKQSEFQSIAFTSETNFFGYKGFMSAIPREMSCRSTNISHVFYINRDDMITVLKEDPLDYEQFCKVRDEYQLYSNSLGEQCFACKSFGHTLMQCSRIHLIKNRQLVVMKYNFTQDQKRESKIRRNMKYYSLKNIEVTSFNAKKYRKKIVLELQKKNQKTTEQKENDNFVDCLISDEEFSKENPYIKFEDEEMVIYNTKQHSGNESPGYDIDEEFNDNNFKNVDDVDDEFVDDGSDSDDTNKSIEEQEQEESVDYEEQAKDRVNNDLRMQDNSGIERKENKGISGQKIHLITNEEQDKIITKQEIASFNTVIKIEDFDIEKHTFNFLAKSKQDFNQLNTQQDENKLSVRILNDDYSKEEQPQLSPEKVSSFQLINMYHGDTLQTDPNIYNSTFQNINEEEKIPTETQKQMKSLDQENQQSFSSLKSGISRKNEMTLKINTKKIGSKQLINKQSLLPTANLKPITDTNQNKANNLNIMKRIQRLSSQSSKLLPSVGVSISDLSSYKKQVSEFSQQRDSFSRKSSLQQESLQFGMQPTNKKCLKRSMTGFAASDLSNLQDSKQIQQSQISKCSAKSKQLTNNKDILQMHTKQNQLLQQVLQALSNKYLLKSQNLDQIPKTEMKNKQQIHQFNDGEDLHEFKAKSPYTYKYSQKHSQGTGIHKRITFQELDLFIFEFDSLKEYQKYFPYNNASNVCLNSQQKIDKKKRISNQMPLKNISLYYQNRQKENESQTSQKQTNILNQFSLHCSQKPQEIIEQ